jgi:very-short-patch-repair endonuclease
MNEKEIVKQYIDNNKSTYDLANMYNTYPNKIRRILVKHGIQLKTKSQAQKNALSNGKSQLPTQGKTRTKEERLKISSSLKKRWDNIDKEAYDEHVKRAKKRWSDMPEQEKKNMSQAAMKAIRTAGKEGSKLEKFLREEISREGYTIETHKKNLIPNENLEIDMYFPEMKTIIEIDGPSHFMPIWGEEKLQKQIKADAHKTGLILSKGFIIIRVKNLADALCLSSRESLKNNLVTMLKSIESKFPTKSKRYIEIEA